VNDFLANSVFAKNWKVQICDRDEGDCRFVSRFHVFFVSRDLPRRTCCRTDCDANF
jgi:hypothetical protein